MSIFMFSSSSSAISLGSSQCVVCCGKYCCVSIPDCVFDETRDIRIHLLLAWPCV